MSELNISNVITVSVSTPPSGLAEYAVNNIALFDKEVPINNMITATNPGIYKSPSDVATDWGANSEAVAVANAIFSQNPNPLSGGGSLIIFPMQSGDLLANVIPAGLVVQFFGGALYAGYAPNDAELIAAAAAVEPIRVKLFASQYLLTSLTASSGVFWIIGQSDEPHTRMLLYTQAGTALGARIMAAAYAGRAMCVDFDGSQTTNTMHLKQLATILVDQGINQSVLNTCQTIGVDVYCSIGGRPSVFTSGANDFFDDVYNLDWFVFALQVAGFNALAETGTKVPQTEPGVAILKGAYINVLNQAVGNGFIAPGVWNSPELFGNPQDLARNVLTVGYYIYSQPVNQQSETDRAARKAPLIQTAIKFAGAIQSSNVIVYTNA